MTTVALVLGIAVAVVAVLLVAWPFLREPAAADDRLDAPTVADERVLALPRGLGQALAPRGALVVEPDCIRVFPVGLGLLRVVVEMDFGTIDPSTLAEMEKAPNLNIAKYDTLSFVYYNSGIPTSCRSALGPLRLRLRAAKASGGR